MQPFNPAQYRGISKMNCQICSKQFSTPNALHEHIGFFQSQLQYHIREFLKCLSHTYSHVDNEEEHHEDGNEETEASCELLNKETDNEESVGLEENHDLRCPRRSCSHWNQQHTYKELQRHFAIHTTCHERCPTCGRVMDRVSTFLHHACKYGMATSSGYVLQRRKALRRDVDRQLRMEMLPKPPRSLRPELLATPTTQPHKKRKGVPDEVTVNDSISLIADAHHRMLETQRSVQFTSEVSSSELTEPQESLEYRVPTGLGDEISTEMNNQLGILLDPTNAWLESNNQQLLPSAPDTHIPHMTSAHDQSFLSASYFVGNSQHHNNLIPGSKAPLMFTDTDMMLGSRAPIICRPLQLYEAEPGYRVLESQSGHTSQITGDNSDVFENLGFGSSSTHGGNC
ncbi:hypothetical protein CT0861_09528 [Colletotrichum tofieldiae]|uniref:C2H2-type domain-containing protein n=1 Tax=Colletotrichum tofieldiae TaxID=708197 RepID=A0A166MTS5_9PEZI|nr:hypothetical protein CT0861_09528 [Colletotrichum tofieldiae]